MVMRVVLGVPGLLAALVASGCFDVHSVEPGPLLIDDFEDGNPDPPDPTFGRWTCGKFSPATTDGFHCGIDVADTGYPSQSKYSLSVDATIEDPPDAMPQGGGVFLETVATETKDFGRFSRLVFAARFDSGLSIRSTPGLDVQIGCNSGKLLPGLPPASIYVFHHTKSFSRDWQVVTVELGDFTMPPGASTMPPTAELMDRTPGCLKVADRIRFSVVAGLPDGESGEVRLYIDDVGLE